MCLPFPFQFDPRSISRDASLLGTTEMRGLEEMAAKALLISPDAGVPAAEDSGSGSRPVDCHGLLYNLSLVVPAVLFVAYLASQARRSVSKLSYGRSYIMMAYYALLWAVSALNILWCVLQAWQCTPAKEFSWNMLSLFTKSGMLFLEISLIAFLLQGNQASDLEALTRTFVVSGVIVAADVLLKLLLMAGIFRVSINSDVHSAHLRSMQVPQLLLAENSSRLSYRTRKSYMPATSLQPQCSMSVSHISNTQHSKDVLEMWRNADAVCFDVDSTICLDEGIDELADFCGAGKAVAEWTNKAMSGSVPFEDALAARLSLFNPSLSQLHEFLDKRPPRISPGIAELISKLKSSSADVYLISGGFRQMIKPIALQLGIPTENIFANQLLFGSFGEFLGFDTSEFTSRSGGKAVAVQHIRKVHGYDALVMIGDGATDLEARKPGGADLFICYGGVQLREAVAAKADWVVFNFEDLLNELK